MEQFLNDFAQAMQQSLAHAIRALVAPLTLKLTNHSEENLTNVEVVLSLPDTVLAQSRTTMRKSTGRTGQRSTEQGRCPSGPG
ncbi:prephenate dehydratase [Streptomyces phaeoluteigriseus]